MARQTSIDVYNKLKASGELGRKRQEVYQILYNLGPLTSGEVLKIIIGNSPVNAINQSRSRLTELRDMGVIQEVGKKHCDVTGNKTILWDVTNKMPTKLNKYKTKADKKKEIIELLKDNGDLFNVALFNTIMGKVKEL